jgi:cytochrome c553
MRFVIFACLLVAVTWTNHVIADGDPAAGQVKGYTCTGCHGIPGYKNVYPMYKVPKIGGQNASYLVSALAAYQEGNRTHPTMRLQAKSLSDQDIADIATWAASMARGSLVEVTGPVPEKVALCQACHGEDGMGIEEDYPVLAGQHVSYLAQALGDYRNGSRQNVIMGGFASTLSDEDIAELSAWYAGMEALTDLSD